MRLNFFVLISLVCASSMVSAMHHSNTAWMEGDEVATKVLLWNPELSKFPFSMSMAVPQPQSAALEPTPAHRASKGA